MTGGASEGVYAGICRTPITQSFLVTLGSPVVPVLLFVVARFPFQVAKPKRVPVL